MLRVSAESSGAGLEIVEREGGTGSQALVGELFSQKGQVEIPLARSIQFD